MNTGKNGRALAFDNEFAFLDLVRRYGHVRHSDVARSLWPRSSKVVASTMAGRTSARLLRNNDITRVHNPLGGFSYLLTPIGARKLGAALDPDDKDDVRSGTGIRSVFGPQFFHRTVGTRYLIEKEIEGFTAYGEYAIFRGHGGISREMFVEKFRKVPDGLVLAKGATRGYDPEITLVDWIEVENYYKPPQEREKILDIAMKSGTWLDAERKLMLHRIVFVYLTINAHQRSITGGIEKFIRTHGIKDQFFFDSIVLAECDVLPPFSWRGYTEKTWLDVLKSRGLDEAGKPISE